MEQLTEEDSKFINQISDLTFLTRVSKYCASSKHLIHKNENPRNLTEEDQNKISDCLEEFIELRDMYLVGLQQYFEDN